MVDSSMARRVIADIHVTARAPNRQSKRGRDVCDDARELTHS